MDETSLLSKTELQKKLRNLKSFKPTSTKSNEKRKAHYRPRDIGSCYKFMVKPIENHPNKIEIDGNRISI